MSCQFGFLEVESGIIIMELAKNRLYTYNMFTEHCDVNIIYFGLMLKT